MSDTDFRQILKALTANDLFAKIAPIVFPGQTLEQTRRQVESIPDTRTFLHQVMDPACRRVIGRTMTTYTCGGLEYIDDGRPCLFVSNHRDIVLDAMLLQCVLMSEGREAAYEVVGTNLYEMPLMALLAEPCKMIGVERGGSAVEYGRALLRLSATMRRHIVGEGESVWIAQSNGRSKNGQDVTDPALIKMIASSGGRRSLSASLEEVHIVPVCVAYEWEPCGPQKAREVCLRRLGPYQKAPGEDTQSIISGVTDFKGHVHFHICQPLDRDDLDNCGESPEAVARLLDQRINRNRRLYANNRIASCLRHGFEQFEEAEAVEAFNRYLDEAEARYPNIPGFRSALIDIYANPADATAASKNSDPMQ